MPWYFPWSDSIKKRACRYLLQHYLGHFLQEKLTLEQLTVDLYNGTGRVENVPLDVWSVNEMLDSCGAPFEIIDGYIKNISVSVPWSALLNDSCCMDIQGLELTVAMRQRSEPGSLTESMIFNSMTTSMELAQECLKQGPSPGEEQVEATTQAFEGLESFAQTIESVLSRIKLSFSDTVIRLEHLPKSMKTGVGLEIHIKRIDYSDLSTELGDKDDQYKAKSVYEPAAFAFKNLKIFGASAYLDEFHEASRTLPPGFDTESPESPPPSPTGGLSSSSLSPHLNGIVNEFAKFDKSSLLPSIQIGSFSGHLEMKVKLKQNVSVPGSKIDIECFFGTLNVFLAPRQVHLLLELASELTLAGDTNESLGLKGTGTANKPMQAEDYRRIEEDLHNQLQAKKHQRVESGHSRVESWNFSFDSSNTVEESSHFSSGTEYDSVLGDDSEEKFYSMPSSQWSTGSHDILPPLEEPMLPPDMMGSKKPSTSLLTQGFGNIPPFNATGPSLTEAASCVFANTQSAGVQGLSPLSGIPHAPKPLSPLTQGLAGIVALEDTSPEAMSLKLKFTSVAITILHVDPVLSPVSDTEDQSNDGYDSQSSHPLQQMAEKFFNGLGTYGFGGKDFEDMKERLAEACPNDHLRCMLTPLNIVFEKSSSSSHQTISSDVSIGRMEVLEYLYERLLSDTLTSPALYSSTQLLNFEPKDEMTNVFFGMAAVHSTPCLRAKYKNTQRTSSPGGIQARNAVLPKTELSLEIGKLCSEVDITIIDRLAELLNPRPMQSNQSSSTQSRMFKSLNPTSLNQQAVFTQALDEGPTSNQRLNIALTCPTLIVMLRFPIPDLRPVVERRPWWKQALREESLLLEFSSLEFKTVLCSAEPTNSYELQFQDLNGFFKESKEAPAVPVLKARTMATDSESSNSGFDWPRIVITVQPSASLSVLEEEQSANNSPLSSLEAYPVMKSEPTPFSSKPVMYEAEELVLPGSQEEMGKFQEDTVSSSHVHIECSIPRLDVNLHEKEFFELIYNRIASDLLLWEPTAPSPVDRSDIHATNIGSAGLDLASQLLQGPDKFIMCRSGLRSYDDSSSDEEDSSNFMSPEHKNNRRGNHENNGQTMLAVTLNVSKGNIALFPVTKEADNPEDSSRNWEDEEHKVHGQLMGDLEDLTFFLAACYKGQVDLSYICLYSKQLHLRHAPVVSSNVHETMETAFSGAELQSTLYPTEPGLKRDGGNSEEPMFSVAAKFLLDPVKNIKEIVLALGLRDVTMRHRIVPSSQLWLTQFSEYLDVQDYPILGFIAPSVVTVLHAHVWQSAVDYRPIHLPLRVLLTMDSFSVSSNLAIESSVSLLRFIIDDAALHISDKCSGQSNLRNYVCVMDLGLFELSLLTSDGNDKRHPKIELRMSSNTLHVRTCSDSCSALLQLVQYIAADGDLVPSYETEDSDSMSSPPTPSRCSSDLPVEQRSLDEGKMSSLMLEAMDDDLTDGEDSYKDSKSDVSHPPQGKSPKRELFLFPDDKPDLRSEVTDAMEGLADDESLNQQTEEDAESDEEFCILDHPDREPEGLTDDVVIKTLTDRDIKIVENHFPITIGRSDQLSAPDHYPPAVFRYCLREMSIVWHMYGGRDLGHHGTDKDNKKKRITFASDVGSPTRVPTTTGSPKASAARSRGGAGRQSDILMELHLNKIRFQFEEYPQDTEQASRLVLLAQEVEVRDRLAHSQINKFLYQYTSEARPKQTHANMITFKMLYMRPDPELKAQECCVRVSVQPLRLNVDQDALFFLRDFFAEISGEASKTSKSSNSVESSPIKQAKPFSSSPLESSPDLMSPDGEEMLSVSLCQETGDEASPHSPNSPQAPTFFRSFIFSPEVPIRLDYQGKHVDMDQGTFAGLLIGLAQLNCSELTLKRLCCRNGLLGFDRLINYALSEWLNDIKRTQLPSILGGVGPVHSFVQLFQGMVDLVWMPIEQYRRDGRVMRGLQRGANSFTTSSAMAFLELTNRAVHIVQTAAETAYDMVSPGPSVSPSKHGRHRLAHQPADLREGVTNAYHVVAKGLNHTATNIVKVAREEHEQKGMTGVVGGVLRQVPATIVQPFILATEATSNVIGGVRNQILPDARREATEKWRSHDQ